MRVYCADAVHAGELEKHLVSIMRRRNISRMKKCGKSKKGDTKMKKKNRSVKSPYKEVGIDIYHFLIKHDDNIENDEPRGKNAYKKRYFKKYAINLLLLLSVLFAGCSTQTKVFEVMPNETVIIPRPGRYKEIIIIGIKDHDDRVLDYDNRRRFNKFYYE